MTWVHTGLEWGSYNPGHIGEQEWEASADNQWEHRERVGWPLPHHTDVFTTRLPGGLNTTLQQQHVKTDQQRVEGSRGSGPGLFVKSVTGSWPFWIKTNIPRLSDPYSLNPAPDLVITESGSGSKFLTESGQQLRKKNNTVVNRIHPDSKKSLT
jgi:hypothetical protein